MVRAFSCSVLFALIASATFAADRPQWNHIGPEVPVVAKQDPPAPMPAAKTWQLGRAKPFKQYDYGRFRAVVGTDGKTRYFPRLGKHTDSGARTTPLPASIDWSKNAADVLARMYKNDALGDCVLASRYHQLGIQTAADTGKGIQATDAEVVAAYHAACGAGDNGCDMSAVNQYQQKVGLKAGGVLHKSDGSVAIDNTNKEIVKAAIAVFGGINIGMSLPNAWYQSADGAVWDVTSSAIVGGHEVQGFAYDDKYVYISTWAGIRKMTWAAFMSTRWVDEVYTTLSPDWYGSDKLAPNGIDNVTLKADLALVANGTVPPLPDPNPPTPVPVPPVPDPPVPVPPVPVPPVPGQGYTGTTTLTKTYVNGVKTKEVFSLGSAGTSGLEDELKAVKGINPKLIVDVLKLVTDVKAKAGRDVILQDLLNIATDFGAAEPKVGESPMPKLVRPETGTAMFRRENAEHALTP